MILISARKNKCHVTVCFSRFSPPTPKNVRRSLRAKKIRATYLLMSAPMLALSGFVLDRRYYNITNGTPPYGQTGCRPSNLVIRRRGCSSSACHLQAVRKARCVCFVVLVFKDACARVSAFKGVCVCLCVQGCVCVCLCVQGCVSAFKGVNW